ncbi:MAG: anti-sigma factor, partial [Acidimicrobiia bacterium]|nr:anti-sigma factor [Acidimicrobiia bacterium]
MSEAIHGLVAAYALDALDTEEAAAFEAHLTDCEACCAELDQLRETAAALAEGLETDPPASLKRSVMDAIDSEPIPLTRRRRTLRRVATAAVAAAAVLALVVLVTSGGRSTIDDVLAAPDAVTIPMDGTHGTAAFTYSASLGDGVFHGEALVELPGDQVYQLWVIRDTDPVPDATFTPATDPEVLITGLAAGEVIAYTVEPTGGSTAPTTGAIATASL